ncbi:hypothetical protein [Butyricicoccus pullicaecorum]|uniref:hypothetical protein n=1 Tax=Butyricicoccus pullicaecorum TaxID=501571 RepID=UPI003520A236
MLTRIWKTYKKQCIIAGVALAAVLIPLYLYFMFQTGIWYQDAFLAEQRDGSFQGKKDGIHYVLHITPTQNGAQIDFSVNGQSRQYEVVKTELDGTHGAQFYENGTPVFEGRVLTSNARTHDYMIATEDFDIVDGLDFRIRGDTEPEPVEYFPGYGTQYGWTVMRLEESYDTRGEPLMLLPALIVAFFLWVDILYPDLFFTLRHGRYVDGDCEPSEYYRFWQVIGRVISAIVIVIFLWMGLLNIV